jgi:hypothetical protein
MANTLRIKRRALGGASGAPTSLAQSELAYSEVDQILFVGQGTGGSATVVAIGGPGAYLTSATAASTYLTSATASSTYLTQSNAASTYLASATAASTYLTQSSAASTYLTQSSAASTYLTQSSASSTYLPLSGGTISSNLVISGNLTVNGTTTSIASSTLTIADKNIELAKGSTTDAAADGGGITIHAAADYTFNWVASTSAWTSSTHLNLLSGMAYKINGTNVLTSTALGSGVTGSSLTSTGTVTAGTWSATIDNTSIDGGTF